MKNINPEILSNKPTHICPNNGLIKVFTLKVKTTDINGRPLRTAEILTGKNAGKWTTVFADELQILGKPKKASEIDASNYIAKYGSAAE